MTFRDVFGVDDGEGPHPHDGGDVSGLAPFIKVKLRQIIDFAVHESNPDAHHQGFGLGDILYVSADDTFDKGDFPGLRAVLVDLVGSGGASGGAPATTGSDFSVGGPGAAGGHSRKLILATDLSASETLTVPAGGTGVSGDVGNNGATCSFGSHCQATGGGGGGIIAAGTALNLLAPATAGLGSGGDLNAFGESVNYSLRITGGSVVGVAQSGASYFSAGRPWISNDNGRAGVHGAGGGGMRNSGTSGARTGGAGGAALIEVKLLF